jgi:hypothetical protein
VVGGEGRGPLQQHRPLLRIAGQGGGELVLGAGLVEATQLLENIGADAGQQVVPGERRHLRELVEQREARRRSVGPRHGDGAVELDDRRSRRDRKRLVQRGDAMPVGGTCGPRTGVAGRDLGLQHVGTGLGSERRGTLERRETTADQQPVPA